MYNVYTVQRTEYMHFYFYHPEVHIVFCTIMLGRSMFYNIVQINIECVGCRYKSV